MTTEPITPIHLAPNWRHVGAFLGLTFGLTWLLDLAIYLRGGLATPGMITVLQLQMLLPAFSAIVLGLFFFPESPIYRGRPAGRGRWFYYYFLLLTVIYALGALGVWLAPAQGTITLVAAIVPLLLSFLGLLLLVVLRFAAGREAMARVWLAWGNWRYWLLFGLAFVACYVLQAALNAVFGLGEANLAPLPAPPGLSPDIVPDRGRGAVGAAGADPGHRHHLRRGVRLAGIPAKRAVQAGPGARRAPAGRDLGSLALADHPDGLQLSGPSAARRGADDALHHRSRRRPGLRRAQVGQRPAGRLSCTPSITRSRPSSWQWASGRSTPPSPSCIGIYGIATLAVVALLILRDPIWRGKGSNLT